MNKLLNEVQRMNKLAGLAEETISMDTDCRTEIGITVGLIDSLISTCRVLKPRLTNDTADEVKGALEDLYDDEDLDFILNFLKKGKKDE